MSRKKKWARELALSLVLVMVIGSVALAGVKAIRFMTEETDPKSVAFFSDLVAEFEKKYPGVKVFPEYVAVEDITLKYFSMARAGIAPDLFYTGSDNTYKAYEMGALLPVDDLIEHFGDIPQNFLDVVTYDGHIYAVPIQSGGQFIWFRKDWFAQKGLTAPRTWGDMLKAAEMLTDKAKDVYGIGLVGLSTWHNQANFIQRMWNAGGYFFDEQNRVALSTKYRKEALKTLAYEKALSKFAPPGFVGHGYMEGRMGFVQGKTAMHMTSGRIPADILRTNPKLDEPGVVGMAAPPLPDEGGRHVMWDGADMWAINADTKYPDVAKNFIKEFMSGDIYIRFLLSVPYHLWPTRTAYGTDPRFINDPLMVKHPDWLKLLKDTMKTRIDFSMEHPGAFNPRFGECLGGRAMGDAINAFFAGTLSAEEVLDETAEAWQDITGWELAPTD